MIVSHKYKFIFIKTNKTAGTSTEMSLSPICGQEDIFSIIHAGYKKVREGSADMHQARNYKGWFNPLPEIIDGSRTPRKTLSEFYHRHKYMTHETAIVAKHRMPKNIWTNYYKFCIERNPFDKVVSMWKMSQSRSKSPRTLENWIRRGKNLPYNYHFYMDKNDNVLVNKIIRFENLNEELQMVMDHLNVPFDGLKVHALSGFRESKDYRGYYNNITRELVEELFEKELKMHDYKF